MSKAKDTDYVFLSAYLRAREARLLSREKQEELLNAGSFSDAAKLLTEYGYEDMSGMNSGEVEKALSRARDSEFRDLAGLAMQRELIDLFCIPHDYHNAKTLIKTCGDTEAARQLLSDAGRVPAEQMIAAYQEEGSELPPVLMDAMIEAKRALAETHNPQTADIILDRAYFAELIKLAEPLDNEFVTNYVRLLIDSANLRAAVRIRRMGRDADFLTEVLAPGGTVAPDGILDKFRQGESFAGLFSSTELASAAVLGEAAIKGGTLTDFEKAADNAVSAYLAGADFISYGIGPVLAYLAAVENQTTALRMILTGWLRGIPAGTIRERLRGGNG